MTRRTKRPTTAFVLGGGGAKGAVQVGQLKALAEAGIVPDALFGSSVGALNSVFVATGFTTERVAELEEVWAGTAARDLFPGGRIERAKKLLARHSSLHDPANLHQLIADGCPIERLEHASIRLEVVTVNLTKGTCEYHGSGEAKTIVAASCALPGIFPPVDIDGDDHVDGGVLDVLPWRRAVAMGYNRIYVLACDAGDSWRAPRTQSPLGIALAAWQLTRHQLAEIGEHPGVTVLPGPSTEAVDANDFTHAATLIAPAYELAAEALRVDTAVPERRRLRAWGRDLAATTGIRR